MTNYWQNKIAAWTHDPAEKSLVLLRDKTGSHESGTVKTLFDELELSSPKSMRQADWYASAADRPQFPIDDDKRYPKWTQVNFAKNPIIKHPLTGKEFDLKSLDEIHPTQMKSLSTHIFRELMVKEPHSGDYDYRRTLLAFWRFASESAPEEIEKLWRILPADTRIPDHSIWQHLDLVSAFEGAIDGDENDTPALLSLSIGPVQGFIAEGRSTSDLWAGSHLLANIIWEGMKVICSNYGPDSFIFPNLRGVPIVDTWLFEELKGTKVADKFKGLDCFNQNTDANPLFTAALPNRFVAIVPYDQCEKIAADVTNAMRAFVAELGEASLDKIMQQIGYDADSQQPYCYEQMKAQLRDFPEVSWSATPWSLAGTVNEVDDTALKSILSEFSENNEPFGFLTSAAWSVLQKDIDLDGAKFYRPNPGVLYPALYDICDRTAAASKEVRGFKQLVQRGYRSTLNGERERMVMSESSLMQTPKESSKNHNDLWRQLAEKRPTWVKKGEALDGLNTIKRLWPSLFTERMEAIINEVHGNSRANLNRYVISTHTLALSVSLNQWLKRKNPLSEKLRSTLLKLDAQPTALPKSLNKAIYQIDNKQLQDDANLFCKRMPQALEQLSQDPEKEQQYKELERMVNEALKTTPERYYAALLMDGDSMGAWVAGSDQDLQISNRDVWAPSLVNSDGLKQICRNNPDLKTYLDEKRWNSPSRHSSISTALNLFSIELARFAVEDCFKGKLIYAGGDDVMALVCIDDVLPVMTLLRSLYSGTDVPCWVMELIKTNQPNWFKGDLCTHFKSKEGYVLLNGKLIMTMGEKATASCGALIAHQKAPFGHVLRRLRLAEQKAKNSGRNAFAIEILKRAGGEIGLTGSWSSDHNEQSSSPNETSMDILAELVGFFATTGVSRRAAYNTIVWIDTLPDAFANEMIPDNLRYQFMRQVESASLKPIARKMAEDFSDFINANNSDAGAAAKRQLKGFLMVAEFLARESRHVAKENNMKEAM